MKVVSSFFVMLALAIASPAFATVSVSSPANGSTVPTSVKFAASASTGCWKGVAAVGVYVDGSLMYQANGTSVNTTLNLATGSHKVAVQEWDYCGSSSNTPLAITVSNQAGVSVIYPANNSTVSSVVPVSATASTACSNGVAAMGVYVNGALVAKQSGAKLSTSITLPAGTQKPVVQAWDNCGGSSNAAVTVNVASGTTLSNLQAVGNWNQWGQYPPVYDICNAPCPGITWSMYQHYSANSLSGNATQFSIGGTTPYADVLWSNKLIGQGTTLNMPDSNHTILPNIHHMKFDSDVYINNIAVMQDLELDVNLYMNGVGMEWGTQCDHLNGNVWDIWNNVDAHWVHTSIPCTLKDKTWNHVTFTVARQSNNDLTYETITVNGQTYNINQTVAPFQVSSTWYGMTVNYQMDGNYQQNSYSTVLDNLAVTYW